MVKALILCYPYMNFSNSRTQFSFFLDNVQSNEDITKNNTVFSSAKPKFFHSHLMCYFGASTPLLTISIYLYFFHNIYLYNASLSFVLIDIYSSKTISFYNSKFLRTIIALDTDLCPSSNSFHWLLYFSWLKPHFFWVTSLLLGLEEMSTMDIGTAFESDYPRHPMIQLAGAASKCAVEWNTQWKVCEGRQAPGNSFLLLSRESYRSFCKQKWSPTEWSACLFAAPCEVSQASHCSGSFLTSIFFPSTFFLVKLQHLNLCLCFAL